MQIKYLPKNIYKMADYSLNQASLDEHRKAIEKPIRNWQKLKNEGVCEKIIAEITGISRAKYSILDFQSKFENLLDAR